MERHSTANVDSLQACKDLCVVNLGDECRSIDYATNKNCYQSKTCKDGNVGGGKIANSPCTLGGVENDGSDTSTYCEITAAYNRVGSISFVAEGQTSRGGALSFATDDGGGWRRGAAAFDLAAAPNRHR